MFLNKEASDIHSLLHNQAVVQFIAANTANVDLTCHGKESFVYYKAFYMMEFSI